MESRNAWALLQEVVLVVFLQYVALRFLRIRGVSPHVFLIWVLYLSWQGRTLFSLGAAFLSGMVYDALVKGHLGWSSILLLVFAYVNSFFHMETVSGRIAVCFVLSVVYFVLYAMDPGHGLVWSRGMIARFSLLFGLYNGLTMAVVDAWITRGIWKRKKLSATS